MNSNEPEQLLKNTPGISAPPPHTTRHSPETNFARQADAAQHGILREFWDFLRHTRKWWLAPVIFVVLLMGLLVLLNSTAAAPFIYTLW